MKILLLGGTGAMGYYLAQLLSKQDCELFITSRKKRNSAYIHYVEGNAHDATFVKDLIKSFGKMDCIVDFMVYNTNEFKMRYKELLSYCKQYVFISTARVYSNADDIISEDTSRLLDVSTDKMLLGSDEYCVTKARQENFLLNSSSKNWTIIRPYITYSNQRLELCVHPKEEWLYRAIHGRAIIFPDDIGKHQTTMTYGKDVAITISKIVGNSKAYNKIFNITNGRAYSWNKILSIYLNTMKDNGINAKVLHVDKVYKLHNPLARYQVIYDRYYDRKFSIKELSDIVDIDQFAITESQLAACLNQFLQNPTFGKIDWMLQGYYDSISHDNVEDKREFGSIKNKFMYYLGKYTKIETVKGDIKIFILKIKQYV